MNNRSNDGISLHATRVVLLFPHAVALEGGLNYSLKLAGLLMRQGATVGMVTLRADRNKCDIPAGEHRNIKRTFQSQRAVMRFNPPVRHLAGLSSSAASTTIDHKLDAHAARDIRLGALPCQLVRGFPPRAVPRHNKVWRHGSTLTWWRRIGIPGRQ